jgi:hypothetical protein
MNQMVHVKSQQDLTASAARVCVVLGRLLGFRSGLPTCPRCGAYGKTGNTCPCG